VHALAPASQAALTAWLLADRLDLCMSRGESVTRGSSGNEKW
jgi:hypothetical protein